jgi:hypothetical protein
VGAEGVSRHRVMRPKFSFADIKGAVRTFRLACHGTKHEAAVDAETQWSVPSEVGGCILRVDGEAGASFKLVQEW